MEDEIPFDSASPAAVAPATPAPQRQTRAPKPPELPPYSEACEVGVIGCCLLDPGNIMDTVSEQLSKFHDDAFYDLRHKILYNRLRSMWEDRKPIDSITLYQALVDSNELAAVGGLDYISAIQDQVPSASNIDVYIKTVIEKAALRGVIRFGHSIIDVAKQAVDGEDVVAKVQSDALLLSDQGSQDRLVSISKGLKDFVEQLEKRKNGRQRITGIKTDLHMFDNMTCGLQAGELTVIAARPSVGKTSLGQTLAVNTLRGGLSVGFWSLEMGEASLIQRFVGSVSRVDSLKLRNGFLSREDEFRLVRGLDEMKGWKSRLFIDDRSSITGRDFYTSVRRAKREKGISLAIVDYVQLMGSSKRCGSREEEIADVADWIKRAAKDLDISVVALAQLNKDSEKDRTPREPRMGDIRESDRICQNADVIGLLWAPKIDQHEYDDMKWIQFHKPDDPKELDSSPDESWSKSTPINLSQGSNSFSFPSSWHREFTFVQMTVAKNRSGATGPCELILQRRTTRFVDAYRPEYGKTDESKGKTVDGVEI